MIVLAKCPHPDCNGKEIQNAPPPYRDTLRNILDKRIQECRFERDHPGHKDEWGLSDTFSDTKIKKRALELAIKEEKIREYLGREDDIGKLLRMMFYKQPITQSYTELHIITVQF